MSKEPTTYDKTAKKPGALIDLLRQYHVIVYDRKDAKVFLSEIGYHRLNSYIVPFRRDEDDKHVEDGTTFDDIKALYYFDFDLRKILYDYLSRIEITFKARLIDIVSLNHEDNPEWYHDRKIVNNDFWDHYDPEKNQYSLTPVVKRHKKRYKGEPTAWKVIETMSLGATLYLYLYLNDDDKSDVYLSYHEKNSADFFQALYIIYEARNACAHNDILYRREFCVDIKEKSKVYYAEIKQSDQRLKTYSFVEAVNVIYLMLKHTSPHRAQLMLEEILEKQEQLLLQLSNKDSSVHKYIANQKRGIEKLFTEEHGQLKESERFEATEEKEEQNVIPVMEGGEEQDELEDAGWGETSEEQEERESLEEPHDLEESEELEELAESRVQEEQEAQKEQDEQIDKKLERKRNRQAHAQAQSATKNKWGKSKKGKKRRNGH